MQNIIKSEAGFRYYASVIIVFLGLFFLSPTVEARSCALIPKQLRPVPVARSGDITLASQNLQEFFDDVKNGPAAVVATEIYQHRIHQLASQIVHGLRSPDIIAVQEAENERVLDALADAVSGLNKARRYQVRHFIGPDSGGHHSGYLIRSDWSVVETEPLLVAEKLGQAKLYDRPPLRIRLRTDKGFIFDVINVHLKSLYGSENPKKADNVARKRARQAEVLAAWLTQRLAQKSEPPFVILGDFNATPEGTGGVDVLAIIHQSGVQWALAELPRKERYSYVYRCGATALDHAYLSSGWTLRDVAFSRGNAGMNTKKRLQFKGAMGSSDHDGLVLYLRAGSDCKLSAFSTCLWH